MDSLKNVSFRAVSGIVVNTFLDVITTILGRHLALDFDVIYMNSPGGTSDDDNSGNIGENNLPDRRAELESRRAELEARLEQARINREYANNCHSDAQDAEDSCSNYDDSFERQMVREMEKQEAIIARTLDELANLANPYLGGDNNANAEGNNGDNDSNNESDNADSDSNEDSNNPGGGTEGPGGNPGPSGNTSSGGSATGGSGGNPGPSNNTPSGGATGGSGGNPGPSSNPPSGGDTHSAFSSLLAHVVLVLSSFFSFVGDILENFPGFFM